MIYFYLQKLKRDLEETVMREQLVRRLVDFNLGAPRRMVDGEWLMANGGTPVRTSTINHQPSTIPNGYPRFTLGGLDQRNLEQVAGLVTKLIDGKVIAPDEPWIREYLGVPAA
ncbi:MAG: hypothetical protein NTU88_00610 [Armatimonadetes bacterium]|nr:hypothetical protein [Armatimonadota bacterium]